MDTTTVEALGTVAERQALITNPMRAMLDEFGPDALVEVTSRHTAFGTFLISITPIEENQS